MQLSIVIVNYNVQYFLEQCLLSVIKACKDIDVEIWVVDNHSIDGSVEMLKKKFPEVKLIANQDNVGFSKANNQALKLAQGKYVLLLNPDTVLGEDTLHKCLAKMEENSHIGALGVKMIDGAGNYLPESKRGFPSPSTAFFKTTGLYRLFPNSGYFNHYYHGNLDASQNNEIEILSGAFMFMRHEALLKAGFLDESFFMYGEDIDLSYRILQAGYVNYYLADTTIIHYKGESTKKSSINYVKTFYQAMIIFANKHVHGPAAGIYIAFIRLSIFIRGFLALIIGFFGKFKMPLIDAALIAIGINVSKNFWSDYKFHNPEYFPEHFNWVNLPLYTGIWMASLLISSAYRKIDNYAKIFRGMALGTLIIAAVYGFLNLDYRTSRAVILISFILALFFLLVFRIILVSLKLKKPALFLLRDSRIIIVGAEAESMRLIKLLEDLITAKKVLGFVQTDGVSDSNRYLGKMSDLSEICRIYKANEIIFCSKDIEAKDIMNWMRTLGPSIQYKILPLEGSFVIGSHSKENLGELYTFDIMLNVNQASFIFQKRITDIVLSCFLLLFSPIWALFVPNAKNLLLNLLNILTSKLSFVGYFKNNQEINKLPVQKPGVLNPLDEYMLGTNDQKLIENLNFLYAKDINISHYLQIIWKGRKKLSRIPMPLNEK